MELALGGTGGEEKAENTVHRYEIKTTLNLIKLLFFIMPYKCYKNEIKSAQST